LSYIERLQQAKAIAAARGAAESEDPWLETLACVVGEVDRYGVAYVSTRWVCDLLDIEPCNRKAGALRRIARCMSSLGWTSRRRAPASTSTAAFSDQRTGKRGRQAEMTEDFQDNAML
jgi:hypothetical protein